jgi:toxin ParE1/3/4
VTRPIEFHPEARGEFREATAFYRKQSRTVATEFAAEIRSAVRRISELPESGSPGTRGVRRKLVNRFPFTLIYRIKPDLIQIIAVMHQRRKPEYWLDRLD